MLFNFLLIIFKRKVGLLSMIAHDQNPRTWEQRQEVPCKFETNLVSKASSKPSGLHS